MKRRIKFMMPVIGILCSLIFCLNACSSQNASIIVSKALGINISNADSFNFTLVLYDTDTKTLYFCKVDT